jgi:alkylated DNA repair dioxygenase AlkB
VTTYRQVAETDKKQKIGLKLLKTKVMLEKEVEDLEAGAPEHHTYDPCLPWPKTNEFPVKADTIRYPQSEMRGADNPLYWTSNRDYGRMKPSEFELPNKFHPLDNKFSSAFNAGRDHDTTLNTFLTPSRVHTNFDA